MELKPLSQIADWVNGTLRGSPDQLITGVTTDSRTVAPGHLFVALTGENFDGHNFLRPAVEAKAAAALVSRYQSELSGFPQIVVPDTLRALQDLAAAYRGSIPVKVVAVTGSNGKTSTKEMIAAILSEKFSVSKNTGNLNNHIGVPLTLLGLEARHEIAVVEMGMNHPGELAPLCRIARPDFGVITNVGVAHIGNLGSKEAIAAEKAVVAESIGPDGLVVLNADDPFSTWIAGRCRARVIRAGIGPGEIKVTEIVHSSHGEQFTVSDSSEIARFDLPVPGEHMISNAVLSIAVGRGLGLTMDQCARGLQKTAIPGGRFKIEHLERLTIMNDAYNANPDSMLAAIRTVSRLPVRGRRVAALGTMGELGAESEEGHRRVGTAVAQAGFDALVTVGQEAGLMATAAADAGLKNARSVRTHEEAVKLLLELLGAEDLLLVKGSLSAHMDRVIQGLEAAQDQGGWRRP